MAPPKTPKPAQTPDFETAMTELEALVERMESGDLSLEDALAAFERGVHLTRHCQQALSAAEQRITTLLEDDSGQFRTTDAAPTGTPEA